MSRQMLICCAVALTLIAGTAGLLKQVSRRQVLAPPGVKTHPLPGSIRLEVELPQNLPGFTSEELKVDDATLATLPNDTSFGMRRYRAADGQTFDLRVVLMGRDRTSMHKPQICLTGQGWRINDLASAQTAVRVQRPVEYDLPVVRLVASAVDAQNQPYGGLYVYWYVADDALSASTTGFQRMWWMARKLLTTGVLQRWAYVSCVAACPPGQETATFERIKEFLATAVPEFQLYPRGTAVVVAATP
jgi:hypothetical protein